jgi:nucleoside-diphosphate-sugar epimerase
VVNVASGTESRTRDVFEILSDLAGMPVRAPEALPPRRLDFQRQCADISRLRSLGFVPEFTLRDTLETILQYYLDEVASAAGG